MGKADFAQKCLVRVGERCSGRQLWMIDGAVDFLHVGHWMKSRGLRVSVFNGDRNEIFEAVAEKIGLCNVLYLEFGVFQGESMRTWSRLLQNPASKLHGFDSFEGLPETWNAQHGRGTFSVDGAVPQIDDSRVKFFKGWFNETLPLYTIPPHEQLFVNVDCDLYSSSKAVLDYLRPHLSVGAYLYFDEFHHREHELKAFDELLSETNMKFKPIAANRQLSHVLFQRVK